MRHRWALLPLLAFGHGMFAATPDLQAAPEVTIPAVIRTDGLHGPIRTDLSIVNRSSSELLVHLQLLSRSNGMSNVVPLQIPALTRGYVHDVVAFVYEDQGDVADEGVLLLRGFVPEASGDVIAETYYEGGANGRIGTPLPVFVEAVGRSSRVLLSSTLAGDPRLNAFSIQSSDSSPAIPVTLEIAASQPGKPAVLVPFTFMAGFYVSIRLSDLLPGLPEDALITLSADDPSLHAMLTRSDPVSGCPFVLASH